MNPFLRTFLTTVCLVSFLGACNPFAPKVVAVVETESFKATFTDARCTNDAVMANLMAQAEMARMMGVPEARIKQILKDEKQGHVTLKELPNRPKEERVFCYSMPEPGVAYVIDDKGGEGPIHLNAPKKN